MYTLQKNIKISEAKSDRTTGHIDESTIIIGDLNVSLSEWRDSTGRKFSCKEMVEINITINQMNITYIHKLFHPRTAEHIFLSSSHGTFIKIEHILDHKQNLKLF